MFNEIRFGNTEETEKCKCNYITALNGFLIACVIAVHCGIMTWSVEMYDWNLVLFVIAAATMMRMPWFFYKSGFFSEHDGSVRTKHYLKKYIRPFVLYGAIGSVVQILVTCVGYGVPFGKWARDFLRIACVNNTVFGNGVLWFLLTLFLVRCFSDFILPKVHPLAVALLSICFAYFHFRCATPKTPWILGNFFSGLCFYSLGFFMKKHENKRWITILSFLMYIGYFLIVAFTPFKFSALYFQHNTTLVGESYLILFPLYFFGIIAIKVTFRWLSKYYSFPIMSYVGRNAMNFFVTHWMVLVVVQFVTDKYFGILGTQRCFYLLVAACVFTLPLISKFINSIKAKKKCTIPIR